MTTTNNTTDTWSDDARAAQRVRDAIARSVSHTEIVHLDYGSEELSILMAECDDYTDANDGVVEFWGTDGDGDEWRVHMRPMHRTQGE